MSRKKLLSWKEIEELDDETYYYIKYLDKQIDEYKHKLEKAEQTLNQVLDLINSSEILVTFPSEKKTIRKPIENYFKGVK